MRRCREWMQDTAAAASRAAQTVDCPSATRKLLVYTSVASINSTLVGRYWSCVRVNDILLNRCIIWMHQGRRRLRRAFGFHSVYFFLFAWLPEVKVVNKRGHRGQSWASRCLAWGNIKVWCRWRWFFWLAVRLMVVTGRDTQKKGQRGTNLITLSHF